MTDLEQMGKLTYRLHELTRPQQRPGRIDEIRTVTDELWNLWLDHYSTYWHHSAPHRIEERCACGAPLPPNSQECDKCAFAEMSYMRELA